MPKNKHFNGVVTIIAEAMTEYLKQTGILPSSSNRSNLEMSLPDWIDYELKQRKVPEKTRVHVRSIIGDVDERKALIMIILLDAITGTDVPKEIKDRAEASLDPHAFKKLLEVFDILQHNDNE